MKSVPSASCLVAIAFGKASAPMPSAFICKIAARFDDKTGCAMCNFKCLAARKCLELF